MKHFHVQYTSYQQLLVKLTNDINSVHTLWWSPKPGRRAWVGKQITLSAQTVERKYVCCSYFSPSVYSFVNFFFAIVGTTTDECT